MGTRNAMTHVSPQYTTHVIIIIITVHCIDSGISNVISVIIIIVIISNDIISIVMPI